MQLQRLLQIRPFVEEIALNLNKKKIIIPVILENEWILISEAVQILECPYEATLQMQKENYAPSDLYASWLKLRLELEKFAHAELAKDMLQGMDERSKSLIDTPTMFAAIFIDPRYKVLLSPHQITIAMNHIKEILKRITKSGQKRFIAESGSSAISAVSANQNLTEIEKLIIQRKTTHPYYASNSAETCHINALYNIPPSDNLNKSCIDFWAAKKTSEPLLYELSCVLNAAAPTQTSVERAFSSLPLILTSHRTRLSDEMLSHILLLRLNPELLLDLSIDP